MLHIIKHFTAIIKVSFIILYIFYPAFALNNQEESEPQKQYQKYEDIKKEHNKDFKKGVYKDEKKDYVNKWISEDINYQKRVIKLKSDYRAWANERQTAGKEIIFNKYEPLKNLTAAEKEILLEYHNRLFKSNDKEKVKVNIAAENKKAQNIKPMKSIDQKITLNKQNESGEIIQDSEENILFDNALSIDEPEIPEGSINIYTYIILGFALILIIAECIYLFVKRIK
jgi:hypothetical protein